MRTPLRALTDPEKADLAKLKEDAASALLLPKLLEELIVSRAALRTVRSYMRCQPPPVRKALEGLPHVRHTSVEYAHD